MLIHYLKITLRGLYRDKAFSIINILGLGIAIACCFLLLFWIKFEVSFENCYPNTSRIYKLIIEEERKDGLHYDGWMKDISKELKKNFPQIEAVAYRQNAYTQLKLDAEGDGDGIMANLASVNQDYLRLFAFDYLEGSPETAIQNGYCVITRDAARKFLVQNHQWIKYLLEE